MKKITTTLLAFVSIVGAASACKNFNYGSSGKAESGAEDPLKDLVNLSANDGAKIIASILTQAAAVVPVGPIGFAQLNAFFEDVDGYVPTTGMDRVVKDASKCNGDSYPKARQAASTPPTGPVLECIDQLAPVAKTSWEALEYNILSQKQFHASLFGMIPDRSIAAPTTTGPAYEFPNDTPINNVTTGVQTVLARTLAASPRAFVSALPTIHFSPPPASKPVCFSTTFVIGSFSTDLRANFKIKDPADKTGGDISRFRLDELFFSAERDFTGSITHNYYRQEFAAGYFNQVDFGYSKLSFTPLFPAAPDFDTIFDDVAINCPGNGSKCLFFRGVDVADVSKCPQIDVISELR
jgi:hypothetical protein